MSNAMPPEDRTSGEHELTQSDANDLGSPPPSHPQVNYSPSNSSPSQSNSKISQPVIKSSKEAALDAWSVFKFIWKDPVNGLQTGLATLGDSRAFNAGIVLCVLFILASWMVVLKIFHISEHFRILFAAAIPVVGMIAVLWCIRQIFKCSGNYKQFTFVTGVCFAPITLLLLLLWLVGIDAGELMVLVSVFCSTTLVLFLNTALIGVLRLSYRNALLLVPVLLVADFFITKVGLKILS